MTSPDLSLIRGLPVSAKRKGRGGPELRGWEAVREREA